jgi:hypothetical protein
VGYTLTERSKSQAIRNFLGIGNMQRKVLAGLLDKWLHAVEES